MVMVIVIEMAIVRVRGLNGGGSATTLSSISMSTSMFI